jgi:hypothetical protein
LLDKLLGFRSEPAEGQDTLFSTNDVWHHAPRFPSGSALILLR